MIRLPANTRWTNGTGFESWENVWGIWNGLTRRDAEAVRRIRRDLKTAKTRFATDDEVAQFRNKSHV